MLCYVINYTLAHIYAQVSALKKPFLTIDSSFTVGDAKLYLRQRGEFLVREIRDVNIYIESNEKVGSSLLIVAAWLFLYSVPSL